MEGGWGLFGILLQTYGSRSTACMSWHFRKIVLQSCCTTAAALPAGKAKCKAALQQELGLRQDPNVPLLGYIGRLDWQKGPDCALDAVEGLHHRGCQTIMLGSGVPEYEQRMRWLYPRPLTLGEGEAWELPWFPCPQHWGPWV